MDTIDRVHPIPGAAVVNFDYEAAEEALRVVNRRMGTIVGEQLPPRAQAADAAAQSWSGHFRREFDDARRNLEVRFEGVAGYGPSGIAGQIRAAAGRANARQTEYNAAQLERERVAEEERLERERRAAGANTPP